MNALPLLRPVSAAVSDVGVVRSVNEDACIERSLPPLAGIWAVADGMGGHDAGDLASQMVVEALQAVAPPANLSDLIDEVEARLRGVHEYLREIAASGGEAAVIGTTVAALLSFRRQSVLLWAGDSRVYLLRDGRTRRLTRDHSEVEDLIDAGRISPAEAEAHPSANVITRAVGGWDEIEFDTRFQALQSRDRYLLCSDGLYKMMSEPEIASGLRAGDPGQACASLVRTCRERGAVDNVSVVVVDFSEEPE